MHVTVRFLPEGREVQVTRGASLISAVRSAGLPMASACRAEGLCGRCGVEIVDGAGALSPEEPDEQSAKRRNRIDRFRRTYIETLYGVDPHDPGVCHLVLDSTAIRLDDCVELIAAAANARRRAISRAP